MPLVLTLIIVFVKRFSNNKFLLFKFKINWVSLISERKENKNILNNISLFKDSGFTNVKYLNKVIKTRHRNISNIFSIISIKDLHDFNNMKSEIIQNRIFNSTNLESFDSGKYDKTNSNLSKNNDDKNQSKITSWMMIIFGIIYFIFIYIIWINVKSLFISDNIPPNEHIFESKNFQNKKSKYDNKKYEMTK